MSQRRAHRQRQTRETKVSVTLVLDGKGALQGSTGNGMLDHLLEQLARHGGMDIALEVEGDTGRGWHHTVEDVAIVMGQALREAVGEGRGIRRMGHALVPMDETLALVAVDISGRGYAALDLGLSGAAVGDLPGDLVSHFLEAMAVEGRITLHARILSGVDPHHKAEALFKAVARALRDALTVEQAIEGDVPSTKGTIRG